MSNNKTNKKQLEDLYIEDLGQVTGGKGKPPWTPTSQALGEEDLVATTLAIGEEDGPSSQAMGEEDPVATTLALGEED